ncbi:MAG: 23S rRNA (adenine(2503)-C(2))-methyltransferase RlmN [Acidobacteriota bacterium]
MSGKANLLGLERADISKLVEELPGARAYTARQIHAWIYVKHTRRFEEMTNLPLALRATLDQAFEISGPVCARVSRSADGTCKCLFELADGEHVESVWIPEPRRNTMCLSTQVGCKMGCTFCATGRMGFRRNLESGEIVGQALHILDDIGYRDRRVNVVFMGMGEGLDNYDEVMRAFRLLADPEGCAISPRRITLSTAGHVPGIERLAAETRSPKLAVSLNSPFDDERSTIMPITRKYPIRRLMEAVRKFMEARHPNGERVRLNERVTFEYVLLKGINDTPAHAAELIRLLRGVPAKLNLLAYNPLPALPYERPEDSRVESFKNALLAANVPVSFRRSRGVDIEAACGQLATAIRRDAGRTV